MKLTCGLIIVSLLEEAIYIVLNRCRPKFAQTTPTRRQGVTQNGQVLLGCGMALEEIMGEVRQI